MVDEKQMVGGTGDGRKHKASASVNIDLTLLLKAQALNTADEGCNQFSGL